MEIVKYPAFFTPAEDEIQVDFPDLPEAFTQGKTMDEAMEFAKLGLAITINDKLGHFEKAPQPSDMAVLQIKNPQKIIKMVTVDLDQY
ncbi:type II toxin-antitoxin system HicB family antitoxin [Limosilactobacillus sp. RRLNB_1_1]|uniref:Type II toxin-antitoxin system HicB family antitoxin n=1 Tax=Limosilactobacillus albertensis TaxID=2759752 RepID=A0A7W3TQ09_9LACO|nr:type II toxin-antitoxin system HicB family antitoxin [Limosilactobacillus albertensis]MBB1068777.1 type II toxin-antitoxin system HicB family antitoxin [Limosilactobacillus albertensis]MCD7117787.1 type II toxin-antitoxin system HicB family antitoxin [Limosilactobacillus albertensis]MCD7129237.1 type II toxin-antitoxin system HicB family antitoxin [Limosilactobacillus albertensis]